MHSLRLSSFYEQTRAAKKIVVVDLGVLGDTLQLIPSLWEIKRNYPAAALHVLSPPVGSELLRLVPCVDRLWPLRIDPAQRSWSEHWQVLRALRRERFCVAFNFSGNDRGTILTGLTGARRRVAYAGGREHFWNRWLVGNWVPRQDRDLPVFEQRRRVLAACGLDLQPPRFDLKIPAQERAWSAAIVPEGAIHLSINAGNPFKEWPLEHNAALLKELWTARPETRVMASAGAKPRERERLRKLAASLGDSPLQLLPENLSIAQLAAALDRCRLHIGPDSGAMHLAMALGLPTVSFFREQGAYKSWQPRGAAHRVISVPCDCVDHHDAPCERLGHAACLARIEPAQVARLVGERLAESETIGSPPRTAREHNG